MAYHGAHIAAAAAAEKQRQLEEDEEEKMTKYNNDNMEKWEFKIVRSDSSAFRKPDVLAELIEEEALSGWEMLEKFDNKRVRFRRPIEARKRDPMLPDYVDPYRTQYGSSPQATAILIGVILLLLGVFAFWGISFRSGNEFSFGGQIPAFVFLIVGIGVVGAAVAFAKSRG